jgi:hypothetical protein
MQRWGKKVSPAEKTNRASGTGVRVAVQLLEGIARFQGQAASGPRGLAKQ